MLDDASRGAVVEHAASFLRPKGGAITAGMAQRFRRQVVAAAIFLSIPEDLSHDPIDVKIFFRAIKLEYLQASTILQSQNNSPVHLYADD